MRQVLNSLYAIIANIQRCQLDLKKKRTKGIIRHQHQIHGTIQQLEEKKRRRTFVSMPSMPNTPLWLR